MPRGSGASLKPPHGPGLYILHGYLISFYKIPFLFKPAGMDYVAIKNIK